VVDKDDSAADDQHGYERREVHNDCQNDDNGPVSGSADFGTFHPTALFSSLRRRVSSAFSSAFSAAISVARSLLLVSNRSVAAKIGAQSNPQKISSKPDLPMWVAQPLRWVIAMVTARIQAQTSTKPPTRLPPNAAMKYRRNRARAGAAA